MRGVLGFSVFVFLLTGCATQQPAPLPADVKISQPSPEVSRQLAQFSGKWHGSWGGTLDTYLIVEKIDPPYAEVIYAWGTNSQVSDPGWVRKTGSFQDDVLVVKLNGEPSIVASFSVNDDGSLAGIYRHEELDTPSYATLALVNSQ